MDGDSVLATLYAAKKYYVPHLASECVRYLENSLTAKNACLLLSQAKLFEEQSLIERSWEVIDAQAELALLSETKNRRMNSPPEGTLSSYGYLLMLIAYP